MKMLSSKIKIKKFEKRNSTKKNLLNDFDNEYNYCCDYICNQCCDYYSENDLSDEEYEEYSEYLTEVRSNFFKNKELKNIFNDDFFNFISQKNLFTNNNVIINIDENNLKDGLVKDCIKEFINENKFNFKLSLNIKFKDVLFNEISSISFRIYNTFKKEDENFLKSIYNNNYLKNNKEYIEIDLLENKNNLKLYNYSKLEKYISKFEKIVFPDYCATNEDKLFYFFAKDYKLFKENHFDLKSVIESDAARELLKIYLF